MKNAHLLPEQADTRRVSTHYMEAQEFLHKHSKWCVNWQTGVAEFLTSHL